jgi:membrane-bound serine protease (ClpP class)
MRTARSVATVIRTGSCSCLPWLAGTLCALVLSASPARAEEPEAAGRFISVRSPLSSEDVNRIRQTTAAELDKFLKARQNSPFAQKQTFRFVFDFTPDGKPSRSDNFGLGYELARHLLTLPRERRVAVSTVAYVHGEAAGYSVLPILACQQVVMSGKAKIGPVLLDGWPSLPQSERTAYIEVGARLNEALVRKLFDRELVVVESKKGGFVDATSPDAVPRAEPRFPIFRPGQLAEYTFPVAREVGLCELDPRENRQDVADAYTLPRESLQEPPLLDRVVAWQIPVRGEVNGALREQLQRRIDRALRKGANLLIFELHCHGGDTAVANSIANELFQVSKANPVVTVAYFTRDAQDTATYLAFGCDHIIMEQGARLGGFKQLLHGQPPEALKAIGDGLEELARQRHYRPALARAFVDSGVVSLFRVESAKGARAWDVLTGRQMTEYRNTPVEARVKHWKIPGEPIPLDSGFLNLDGEQARRLGLVSAEARDLNALYDAYGVKASEVQVAGQDWLDDLADFLRNEWVSFLLVMIGITCLILELKLPGVGLPGVVAALCFVLYFWSHSQVAGQVTWLAILLFLLGLVLIGIEVFVLPGFGICGLSGIILMVGSLALAASGHWPRSGAEWSDLSSRLMPIALGLVGAVVLAMLLGRYLPSIPFANRLLLRPEGDGETPGAEPDPGQVAHAALLGAIGVAATPLRPAGKVQFGDQFVDVLAEGSYIVPGTRVQVVEIEGNRIVVKPV